MTLVNGVLKTVMGRLQVWNLFLDIIALSGDLRCALQLRNCLQYGHTGHVRNILALLKSDNSQKLKVMLERPKPTT